MQQRALFRNANHRALRSITLSRRRRRRRQRQRNRQDNRLPTRVNTRNKYQRKQRPCQRHMLQLILRRHVNSRMIIPNISRHRRQNQSSTKHNRQRNSLPRSLPIIHTFRNHKFRSILQSIRRRPTRIPSHRQRRRNSMHRSRTTMFIRRTRLIMSSSLQSSTTENRLSNRRRRRSQLTPTRTMRNRNHTHRRHSGGQRSSQRIRRPRRKNHNRSLVTQLCNNSGRPMSQRRPCSTRRRNRSDNTNTTHSLTKINSTTKQYELHYTVQCNP